jgi:chromosome segregation protein
MDEVEPALDDVNLHRFLRLIDGFANDSQVLIVTHQKRTMEIAGLMYGVSLSRDGTTKVVCQQMEEPRAAREERARLAAERERAEASIVETQTSADEEPDALQVPESMPESEPVH